MAEKKKERAKNKKPEKPAYMMTFEEYHAVTGKGRAEHRDDDHKSFVADLKKGPGTPPYEAVKPFIVNGEITPEKLKSIYFDIVSDAGFITHEEAAEQMALNQKVVEQELKKAFHEAYGGTPEEIQARMDEVAQMEQQVARREQAIETKEKELNDYEEELRRRDDELRAYEAELDERQAEIDEVVTKLEETADALAGTPDHSSDLERIKAYNQEATGLLGAPAGAPPLLPEQVVEEPAQEEPPYGASEVERAAPMAIYEATLENPLDVEFYRAILEEEMGSYGDDVKVKIEPAPDNDSSVRVKTNNTLVIARAQELEKGFTGKKIEIHFTEAELTALKGVDGAVGDYIRRLDDWGRIEKTFWAKLARRFVSMPYFAKVPEAAAKRIERDKVLYGIQKKAADAEKLAGQMGDRARPRDALDEIIGENGFSEGDLGWHENPEKMGEKTAEEEAEQK